MSSGFRFLTENYADLEILANYTVSSERASYPVTNAFNRSRRTKVWRSNGYYKVVSGDNTIKFRETALGPDLIATVTAGAYTSTAALMAAIKSALEAVGASTYTVTQDSNLKFVITSNGAGGGGIFSIYWDVSTDMAELLGYDTAAPDTGALAYTADVMRLHTEEFIDIDCGIPSKPNAVALTSQRNRPLRISPSATIKLLGNTTNLFDSPKLDLTLDYDDAIIASIVDDAFYSQALRHFRLKFIDKQNPHGFIELGSFFIGRWYAPDRGRPQFPFEISEVDLSETSYSEGGQSFSKIGEQTENFQVRWDALTNEEREEIIEIFETYGTHSPFFVSFDSNQAFSSSINRMVKVVKWTSAPSFSLRSAKLWECQMNFREEL